MKTYIFTKTRVNVYFLSTSNMNTARLMDTKMSFILGLCLTLLIDISLSSAFDLDCLSVAKKQLDLGCLSGTKGKTML